MLGPNGVGVLYGRRSLLQQMPPYQMGGDMIRKVGKFATEWEAIPAKFEAGTPPIAEAIALSRAADFLQEIGLANILQHEKALMQYTLDQLQSLPGIVLYGEQSAENRGGVLSFNLDGAHAFDVATLLAEQNIAMRAGHHCCQVLMQELNVDATCRISFYLYNNFAEIDTFIQALKKAKRILSR
jgi:cysteine desulfurase/selenocysteine lyase